jgi:hypothetical protein
MNFQHYIGDAQKALSLWWRNANSEDIWYYGSLTFFFAVVAFVLIRRIPIFKFFLLLF